MLHVPATLNDETLAADLFHTKRLFIAGTRVLLLCVDLKQKPAAPDSFLSGPSSPLPPSAAMMDDAGEQQDTFSRKAECLSTG